MSDAPGITIKFDPITWQVVNVKFTATTDSEFNQLREITKEGIRETPILEELGK